MLTGLEHRQRHRKADSGRASSRTCSGDSRPWYGLAWRNQSRREKIRSEGASEQLLRVDGHPDDFGLCRYRDGKRRNGREQRTSRTLKAFLFLVLATLS